MILNNDKHIFTSKTITCYINNIYCYSPSCVYNLLAYHHQFMKNTFVQGQFFKYSSKQLVITLKSAYARIPSIIFFVYKVFY